MLWTCYGALENAETRELNGYAAFARYRLGQLLGGEEGTGLVNEADSWLRNEGVVNPPRFVQAHAPGFGYAQGPLTAKESEPIRGSLGGLAVNNLRGIPAASNQQKERT